MNGLGHIAPQTVQDHEAALRSGQPGVLETTHMEKNWEPPP